MPDNAKDIKSWEIVKLLAEKYNETGHYVCATEVSNGTGAYARRRLDFVAVDCWPSSGLNIMGFEIKVSKSDFRRELFDPSKHNIFFDEIDYYSIVAPDYVLDDQRIIPPKWGIVHVVRNDGGELVFKTVRKPLALHDEKDRKIGRGFMASLIRAIDKQGATKARLTEERDKLEARIRADVEEKMANGRVVASWEYQRLCEYRDVCAKLGISGYGGEISEWEAKLFRQAMSVVRDIEHVETSVRSMLDGAKCAHRSVKELLESMNKPAAHAEGTLYGILGRIDDASTAQEERRENEEANGIKPSCP